MSHSYGKLVSLLLVFLLGSAAALAGPVSKREVLAAIAVIEKDVTSDAAPEAAATVTRFGEESDAVLITIGPETMPWLTDDAPTAELAPRAMLTAAYFAGNIKAQLMRGRCNDDPYSGWLFVLTAYQQIRRKQPELIIPEVEEMADQEQTGILRSRADTIWQQEDELVRRANTV
ncbi:MAG: hypothetical protein PHQ04_01775 [Opitutaceae bacterium]|nr:hypothetical protein [Opitutaceae bacterium]